MFFFFLLLHLLLLEALEMVCVIMLVYSYIWINYKFYRRFLTIHCPVFHFISKPCAKFYNFPKNTTKFSIDHKFLQVVADPWLEKAMGMGRWVARFSCYYHLQKPYFAWVAFSTISHRYGFEFYLKLHYALCGRYINIYIIVPLYMYVNVKCISLHVVPVDCRLFTCDKY